MLKSILIAAIGIAVGFVGGQLLLSNQSALESNSKADPETRLTQKRYSRFDIKMLNTAWQPWKRLSKPK